MPPPIAKIGINCDHFPGSPRIVGLRDSYYRAVLAAGGVPLMIPFLETAGQIDAALDAVDGFILTGGDDLRPERLRAPAHPASTPVDPDRDASDFLLLDALIARRIPTLAICLGCQELNVRCGGTVYQDLPAELPEGALVHRGPMGTPEQYVLHEVRVDPGTRLSALWEGARTAQVNSSHHQAIRDLGAGLKRAAVAPDGVVEAVELPGQPFCLGVQWHPERMAGDSRQTALFSALVAEAAARAALGAGAA